MNKNDIFSLAIGTFSSTSIPLAGVSAVFANAAGAWAAGVVAGGFVTALTIAAMAIGADFKTAPALGGFLTGLAAAGLVCAFLDEPARAATGPDIPVQAGALEDSGKGLKAAPFNQFDWPLLSTKVEGYRPL